MTTYRPLLIAVARFAVVAILGVVLFDRLLAWTVVECLAFAVGCAALVLLWIAFSLTEERREKQR
mgnify:FL=1